jgi:membrane-bound lytic murein transglycosylase D
MRSYLLLYLLAISSTALGVSSGNGLSFHEFPVPKKVARQVLFWEAVFSKYGDRQVVIHDVAQPDLVIDLIDFDAIKEQLRQEGNIARNDREEIVAKYVERYQIAVANFAKEGSEASRIGPMEKRIYQVYKRDESAMRRLLNGEVSFRGQGGLADEFQRAAKIANQYLPYMERTFMKAGLPRDLTRLAFVESMFNLKATSKVGASGIWQFMPGTAKRFLIVNKVIDERRSPLRATDAAAKYLAHNYQKLGKWPLAITAYNHGAGGIARAVREVGSDNIEDLISKYQSPSFGFASKNFYAEFIAARNIYQRLYKKNQSPGSNPLKIAILNLPKPLTYREVVAMSGVSESRFRELNPAISATIARRYSTQLLPSGLHIVVPSEQAPKIEARFSQVVKKSPKMRS